MILEYIIMITPVIFSFLLGAEAEDGGRYRCAVMSEDNEVVDESRILVVGKYELLLSVRSSMIECIPIS